jgi:hypothetical protein
METLRSKRAASLTRADTVDPSEQIENEINAPKGYTTQPFDAQTLAQGGPGVSAHKR